MEMLAYPLNQVHLFLERQAGDGRLNDPTQRHLIYCNKTMVIHVDEEAHDELAVHSIGHTAMAGNWVTKVFDLEGALETRGEEAAERGN